MRGFITILLAGFCWRDAQGRKMLAGMKEEGVLNVLNGFITAHISGNCSEKAYDELERQGNRRLPQQPQLLQRQQCHQKETRT